MTEISFTEAELDALGKDMDSAQARYEALEAKANAMLLHAAGEIAGLKKQIAALTTLVEFGADCASIGHLGLKIRRRLAEIERGEFE